MNNNKLFSLAYIIFVFICAIVKCFWDYPLWNTFVAAITTASWLLSFANLSYIQSKHWKSNAEEQLKYSEMALLEIELIKRTLSTKLMQSDHFIGAGLLSKEDNVSYYKDTHNQVLCIEKEYKEIRGDVDKRKTIAKAFEISSVICNLLGYLSLFCILVFPPLLDCVVACQEMMTIYSFGLILLSQFLDDMFKENLMKRIVEDDKCKNALDVLRINFETEVIHNAD